MSQENTVRLVLVQKEGGEEISNVQMEWYGFNREGANDVSMALAQAAVDTINKIRGADSRKSR